MKIVFNCPWVSKGYSKTNADGTIAITNIFDPTAKWVIDMSLPAFSSLSEQYPPEKRIFASAEPSGYMGYTKETIKKFGEFYKGGILSWHKQIQHLTQTIPFKMGTSWVTWKVTEPVKFGIGGMFSGKNNNSFDGYAVRKKIIGLENYIKIPSMIFHPGKSWKGVSYEYPQLSKKPSLEYMFHFAIENCSEEGYFTEKLIDCFESNCIPIYFGDPKISEVFDSRGIIVLDTNNITKQVNNLNIDTYNKMKPFLEENKKRSVPFLRFEENIIDTIKRRLK